MCNLIFRIVGILRVVFIKVRFFCSRMFNKFCGGRRGYGLVMVKFGFVFRVWVWSFRSVSFLLVFIF